MRPTYRGRCHELSKIKRFTRIDVDRAVSHNKMEQFMQRVHDIAIGDK